MSTESELQTDHSWDNRRLILASLAPRTAARPARHNVADETTATETPAPAGKPHLVTRGLRAGGRAILAGGRQLTGRIPRERRLHYTVIATAITVVLIMALAGVRYLTTDMTTPAATTARSAPPPPSQLPLRPDTILTGFTATDVCPRDANYADANRAGDGDIATAWVCTRAKNQDGQTLQIDFGRQVTVTQVRVIGGFDATAPDGTDQWSQHRLVTQLEMWFPKDLKRDPITIDTGGDRDWRAIPGGLNPPATVSKLLIRIKETSDPPQPPTPTKEAGTEAPDDLTSVAISEIQFIGHDGGQ